MTRRHALTHAFVEYMPEDPTAGVLYVSLRYRTVLHRCCCGCDVEVVTPLSPAEWKLVFDGETVSLFPSIGNWGLRCQSHYWIRENRVVWARRWTAEEIADGRAIDEHDLARRLAVESPDSTTGMPIAEIPAGPAERPAV